MPACVPFEQAAAAGVDFLIVHHGLFWAPPRPITGPTHRKLATLLRGNCALYSSHLPLDAHPQIGNNALLARQLGLKPAPAVSGARRRGHRLHRPRSPAPARRAAPQARRHSTRASWRSSSAPPAPRAVAFCSGSGNSAVPELAPAGVDTLVTGELREEWFNYAQEHRLNLYLCGHYATEVHGVKALAAELAKKFRLPWEFIATGNPL